MIRTQQGFLSLVAVVLIVIIAFLGLAVTYMVVGSAAATNSFMQSEIAFYIGEAGMEKTVRFLTTPMLTGTNLRHACSAIDGDADLTNSSFNNGTFTITDAGSSPYYAFSTLNGAITSSATTVTVVSTTGFAPSGRILIDREAIDYSTISGNSFVGVTRGVNGTNAVPHSSGATVSQYQCYINAMAGIPNLTTPLFKRQLQENVQLQEAWTVGSATGSAFVLSHWNRPTELQWSNANIASAVDRDLNAVSITSNGDGWAVGQANGTNIIMLHLTSTGWQTVTTSGGCSGQVLFGVSTVSSQEAWAVGDRTNCHSATRRYGVLRWNGTTWTEMAPPTIPADNNNNQNLIAVHVIDTTNSGSGNFGFAVGEGGQILRYNGSAWSSVTSPVTTALNGVFVVSANEAWAVGNSGRILKWNGTSWGIFTSPTGTTLQSVYMLDTDNDGLANTGWAVGNNGVAAEYDGTSWTSRNAGGNTLNGVALYNADDVWAVGAGGRVIHWDGNAWTTFSSGVTQALNGIDVVPQKQYPFSGWQEVFP